ncbi:NTTRR-F1 domain [Bacillus paramobilis]|uniref:NTTRR-F1 domain n=1 Tax=Bacillus paramobilis TaxID=2817477 RepID=UPI0032178A7D
MINNRIVNGGFETGALSPFIVNNVSSVSIDNAHSHSGIFSARLSGDATIAQAVPVSPNETFQLFVSLAKFGATPSPSMFIAVAYYTSASVFLGYGLLTPIVFNRIPDNNEKDWLEFYGTTSSVPATATQALVIISKASEAGSADVFVDDLALLAVTDVIGPSSTCSCSELLFDIELGDFVIVNTTCGTESGILESVSSEGIQLKDTTDNSGTVNTINICCKTICSIRKVLISKIAFTSTRDGNAEIYVMNADGSNQTRLTNNAASDSDPAWSPDGQKIAFSSTRDGNNEIYVMNADGTNQTRLTNNVAFDLNPAWSPDGQKIVFSSNRDGNTEIYVMNADGTNQTRLTNNPADDRDPTWSPDGQKIAFTSLRDGNDEIYVMNADGTNQTRLTNNLANDRESTWSPDGQKIAFTSFRDVNLNGAIYVMNANGTNQTRLTNNSSASDLAPTWSPDGQKIAFLSTRDGNPEIYVMNADGTNQIRLTNNLASDLNPAWSPFMRP